KTAPMQAFCRRAGSRCHTPPSGPPGHHAVAAASANKTPAEVAGLLIQVILREASAVMAAYSSTAAVIHQRAGEALRHVSTAAPISTRYSVSAAAIAPPVRLDAGALGFMSIPCLSCC